MVEYRASYVPGTEPPARPESSAGPADSSLGRGRFFGELSDPATLNRLIAYTDAEVGGEGPDAHQAFIESVLNRSVARNQPLATTLSGDYFPSETHRKADRSVSEGEIGAYSGAIGKVLGGSNITNYATGNASGDVGFNKGPQTAQFGRERFGQEGPDVGWWNKLGLVSSAQAQEAPQQVAQAKGISAPAVSDTQYRASTVGNAPLYRASVVPEVAPSETPVKGVEAPPVEGEPAPSESFEVTKGFKGALFGTEPKVFGGAMEAAGILGNSSWLQDTGKGIQSYGEGEIKQFAPAVPSFTDIPGEGVMDTLGRAGKYAGYALGQGAGTSLPGMAVGIPTAMLTANPIIGIAAGMALPAYLQNWGDAFTSAKEDKDIAKYLQDGQVTPKQLAMVSAVAAVPMAALDSFGAGKVLGTAALEAKRGLTRSLMKAVAHGAITEGSTEGMQEVISQWSRDYLGSHPELRDRVIAIVDSVLGGMVPGGAFAGAARVGTRQGTPVPAQPAEVSVEQLTAQPGDQIPAPVSPEAALATVKPDPGRVAPIQGIPATNPADQTIVPPQGGEIRFQQTEELPKPNFYSALLRAAQTKLPESGSPQQMMATLENQSGVKPVEVDETGLRTFLQSAPQGGRDKVSKQEIVEYLEENQIQVEETISTKHYLNSDANSWIMVPGQLRWEGYVAPGPTQSYMELRLSVPVKPGAMAYYDEHWNDPRQMDAPNVVGHVQGTARINKAGKPIFHIEGFQGQWQQLGRAVGYLTKEEASRVVELRARQGKIKTELDALRQGIITAEELPMIRERYNQLALEYRAAGREVDGLRMTSAERPGQRKPPPSPFKSDWVNLLAKRMYRWAADNGYSELSWATPELAAAWNTGRQGDLESVPPSTRQFLNTLYGTMIPNAMKKIARGYGGVLGASEIVTRVRPGDTGVRVMHVTVPEGARTAIQQGMPVYEMKERGPAADISFKEGPGIERISYPFREGMRKIVGSVNEFAKKFGIDAKIDVRVVAGDTAKVGGHTVSNSYGVAWRKPDGRYEIVLFAGQFKNNLPSFLATAMHEFGHVVVWEKFDALPDTTKHQIMGEFLDWRDARIKSGSQEELFATRKAPASWWMMRHDVDTGAKLSQFSARQQDYHLGDVSGFHEYMADQIAKWATTTAEPLSVVERAWSGIGKALRLFQEWMGKEFGVETRATLTVQNWLNSFLKAAPVTEQQYAAMDIRTQKQNQFWVGEDSGDPDVSMPPQQPETAPIRAQIGEAFKGKVPGEVKAAGAHADHISWIYKWMGSILDLVQRNPNFAPLMRYVENARDKDRVETKIQDVAIGIAKAWRGLGRKGEEKLAHFIDELTNMTYLTEEEKKRGTVRHPTVEDVKALVKKTEIDDKGLAIVVQVRKFTEGMLDKFADLSRAAAMKIIDPVARAQKLDEINAKVRNLKAKPYFPFMRFGLHFVKIVNANGVVTHFQTFERKGLISAERQQQSKAEQLRGVVGPGEEVKVGKLPATSEPFMGLPPNMLDLIREKLILTPSQLDALSQLQFQMSPAQSYMHFFQHKRYVPGYSRDFLRAFSRYAFHGSRYYAKALYVDAMRQNIRDAHAVGGNKATEIGDFMTDHLENTILNVKGDYGILKGMMFFWAMGYSPASATLNMTQTPMITFPFLASHFGILKASRKMSNVMTKLSTFYKRGTYEGMPDWQMQGLSHGIRTKRIVETQAPELAAMSQGGIFKFSSGANAAQRAANQILEKSAFMFESIEQWNRRIVFRATMQLAYENPGSRLEQEAMKRYPGEYRELTEKQGLGDREARAIVTAGHATDRTQFVYAGWARPRFMRGKYLGAVFIFKRYLQSLMFLLGSDKKFFFHYALVAAALGGLGGIPGAEDTKNLIQAMLRFLGFNADVEKAMMTYIKDNLGESIVPADVILHGLARRGFGIPAALDALGSVFTGRPGRGLDMTKQGQNVPAPVFDRSKAVTPGPIIPEAVWQLMDPGKEVGESIGGASSQALGYGFSAAVNMFKAISDNHLHWTDLKRWEKAEPRALASLSKMYRGLTEADPDRPGFTRERSGGPQSGTTVTRYDLRDPEQLMEVLGVGLGYNDLRRANEWNRITHQNEHTKYIDIQRKGLMEQYDEARQSSPQEFDALLQKIQDFNEGLSDVDKGKAITSKSIKESMQGRARQKAARENNIPVQKGNRPIAEEYERIYPRTIEVIPR